MELDEYILELLEQCEKAINHYAFELSKISTGRANPQIVRGIRINYYDTMTPLEELANVTVPEAQQLLIKPYDISITHEIAKVILAANLGVSISNEGNQVRLTFPALTTERRKEMVHNLSKYTENAKVGIRNARQSINKLIKANEELSEDIQKRYLDEIQKEVDKQIDKIDKMTAEKEKDLLTM